MLDRCMYWLESNANIGAEFPKLNKMRPWPCQGLCPCEDAEGAGVFYFPSCHFEQALPKKPKLPSLFLDMPFFNSSSFSGIYLKCQRPDAWAVDLYHIHHSQHSHNPNHHHYQILAPQCLGSWAEPGEAHWGRQLTWQWSQSERLILVAIYYKKEHWVWSSIAL